MGPPPLLAAATSTSTTTTSTRQTTRLMILHPFVLVVVKVPALLLIVLLAGTTKQLQWSVQAFLTSHHRAAIPILQLQQQRPRSFPCSRQRRMPCVFLYHGHHDDLLQSQTTTRTRTGNHPFSRLLLILPNAAAPRDHDTTAAAAGASTQQQTTPPLPDTTDPYQILNLLPTADRKEIKRAYRRMALLYHPDVRTNGNSTEQERKNANDDFARINAAYAFLMGKSDEQPSSRGGSSSKKSSSGGGRYGGGGYTPPHRRTASSSSTGSSSVDWQDFMPKYDAEEYDAGGDSFASIFADLLSGIGSGSAGTGGSSSAGGILNDLISFLEGNFPSVGKYQQTQEDVILNSLLRDGSMEEIKDELDDAKLLVRQLEQKQMDLDLELQAVNVERQRMTENQKDDGMGRKSNTYMEDMRLEEKKRELEVRKEVVGEYLERARMRQLRLRKRIEELKMMMRDNSYNDDDFAKSARQRESGSSYSTGNGSFPRGNDNDANVGSNSGSGSGSGTRNNNQDDREDEPSWKTEGFGTSRRRRRSSSRSRPSSSSSRSTAFSEDSGMGNGQNTSTGTSTRTASNNTYYRNNVVGKEQSVVPPHRRLTSRYEQVQQDKKRLREIKVDEEIEKMKNELGLN